MLPDITKKIGQPRKTNSNISLKKRKMKTKKIKRMPLLLNTIENFSFVSSHPRSYYTALKFNIIYRCKPLPLSVCLSLISFNHSTLIIITTIPSHHQYRRLSLSFSYTCRDGCSFLFVLFVCFFFQSFPTLY